MCDGDKIKSINSKTNNKSPGNDGLTAEFHEHFPNELALVVSYIYDSSGKLETMSVTSRTEIISALYKKGDRKCIANYRPIPLLNVGYKIDTTNS